jgi:hypothetical protein
MLTHQARVQDHEEKSYNHNVMLRVGKGSVFHASVPEHVSIEHDCVTLTKVDCDSGPDRSSQSLHAHISKLNAKRCL